MLKKNYFCYPFLKILKNSIKTGTWDKIFDRAFLKILFMGINQELALKALLSEQK